MSDEKLFTWSTFETFAGSELNPARWQVRETTAADGTVVRREDPHSQWTFADATMTVRVERFCRRNDQDQGADNGKLVVLSVPTFDVPPSGAIAFSVEMSAAKIGGRAEDFRDGFVSFNVVDFATGMVLDVITTGERIGAIFERLPYDAVGSFAYLVDSPMHAPRTSPGAWHRYMVVIDVEQRTGRFLVDGVEIFAAQGLPVPERVAIGMGMLTVRPLDVHGSTSLRGQGLEGQWRNVRVGLRG